ncbi:methyltransferase domain-containing protein [bacterium]|nr:methyltransferase domain-containing protein [bacterium]
MSSTTLENINTPDYWNAVYRREWESGAPVSGDYSRDYGPIHEAVINLIPDGGHVLDIACGPGVLCRKIKQQRPACRVMGIDFSEYTIARNLERDAELGIEYRPIDVRRDLASLPGQFDVVTMCEILEHLDDPEAVVAAAIGQLKMGGRFIITCPHKDEIPDPEHVRMWDHDELFHLLARYGETVSFTHFPPPYFHIWMMGHVIKTTDGEEA